MVNEGIFTMTSDHLGQCHHTRCSKPCRKSYSFGKPDDIASAVIDKLLGNQEIQASIQQLLYDLIHGNLEEITQSPEEIAQKLAELLVQKLKGSGLGNPDL